MCVTGPLSFINQREQSINDFTASLPLQVISKNQWTVLTRVILWNMPEQRLDEWARTVCILIQTSDCVVVTLRKGKHLCDLPNKINMIFLIFQTTYLNLKFKYHDFTGVFFLQILWKPNWTYTLYSSECGGVCAEKYRYRSFKLGQHKLRVNIHSFSLVFQLSLCQPW